MSTPQRIHARVMLVVDRTTADVLRLEAKKILMFGHELFEDYLDLSHGRLGPRRDRREGRHVQRSRDR
jgi:hypothetical protein